MPSTLQKPNKPGRPRRYTHDIAAPFHCVKCRKEFGNMNGLRLHWVRVHGMLQGSPGRAGKGLPPLSNASAATPPAASGDNPPRNELHVCPCCAAQLDGLARSFDRELIHCPYCATNLAGVRLAL